MAIKATIYKIHAELADMDRNLYGEYSLTIASHPSETDERMLIRFLAFILNVTETSDQGGLEFGNDICDTEGPSVCKKDLTGQIEHWIEVGQPDDRRIMKASGRGERITIYSFATSVPIWWAEIAGKVTRAKRLTVWQIPAAESQALSRLAQRRMELQVTVQDGTVWVSNGTDSVEITPLRLYSAE